jgi:ribosomal protein S18 acetylase RimI-like enzyme
VVGYALAYRFPSLYSADNLAYLYDIEVLPSQRKKGVGHKLIENILANLKADGVTELL